MYVLEYRPAHFCIAVFDFFFTYVSNQTISMVKGARATKKVEIRYINELFSLYLPFFFSNTYIPRLNLIQRRSNQMKRGRGGKLKSTPIVIYQFDQFLVTEIIFRIEKISVSTGVISKSSCLWSFNPNNFVQKFPKIKKFFQITILGRNFLIIENLFFKK